MDKNQNDDPVNDKDNKTQPLNVEWMKIGNKQNERQKELRKVLSGIPLFENLSRNDWRELIPLFHVREYKDGEIIFEEGTPGLGMYVILDGAVRVLGAEKQAELQYATLGQGDFFGEMSLIDEVKRSATTVASGSSRLIGIFRPQLQQIIHHRPKLGVVLLERLAGIVARRLREANRLLEETRRQIDSEKA